MLPSAVGRDLLCSSLVRSSTGWSLQEGSELTEASLGPPSGMRQAEYPGEWALLGPPLAQVVSVLHCLANLRLLWTKVEASLSPPSGLRQAEYPGELARF